MMKATHLAIQLSEHAIHFVSLENDVVLHESFVSLEQSSKSQKEVLNNHFLVTNFLNNDFNEITLSWSFKQTTLVPNSIFSGSSPNEIFELCFGKDSIKHDIDYNRISNLNLINIYEIPIWIKYYFVIKFPRIIIQHEGSHVIRKNLTENNINLNSTVILHQGYFQLTILKNNNLEFYSSFDYQNHEDIIYHLMFVLQQKEMTNENGILKLIVGPGVNRLILDKLKLDITRIRDLQKLKVNYPEYYIAKSQLLCV